MGYSDYYANYYNYSDYYDYAYTTSDLGLSAIIGAVLGAYLAVTLVIGLIILILQIAATWKVFTKAGEKGWKSIIPIYSNVILFRVAGISPWLILLYLLTFIPFVGWIVFIALSIYYCNSLAKSFGKDVGYTIGLLFLPTIFMLILGFGDAQYVGKKYSASGSAYNRNEVIDITEDSKNVSSTDNDEDIF